MTGPDIDRESSVLVDRGIPFRETEDRHLELDVYHPRDIDDYDDSYTSNTDSGVETDGERPIVVFVYGGGWTDGSTGQFARYALAFAAAGWIAIECSYRLADEARFPAQVVDVHAALDWVGTHADEFGGDADRLAIAGHSAGAHLAALASLTRDHPTLTPSSRSASPPSIGAVAGISGVYDFDSSADSREDFADRLADHDAERPIGTQRRLASPVAHVSAAEPASPTLLLHGSDDEVVPPAQSERYRAVLEDADATVELETVPDGDHVFLHSSSEYPATRDRLLAFFDDHI